jgi:hypothetical protein
MPESRKLHVMMKTPPGDAPKKVRIQHGTISKPTGTCYRVFT